ncbi:hypothetical protein PPERSA_02273 [Pseudocohnilembus persalinus]|uniref:Transmembrane protein n=1 Tax=Pseudocohnilembus persalinus TaxID=266149 RepID=A0A0V0QKJ6_PSEPJ|nr:hypothetical protein PPERSA_02273 [Pseudocohnilembus persalinus]|eukprot:KRX02783.1 hypothetical protein PPERSA_02273 [Pseudocohnilembus persalinus]
MSYFLLFFGKAKKYIYYNLLNPIKLRNKIESQNFFLNPQQNQFNINTVKNLDFEKQSVMKTVISDSYKFDRISKVNVNLDYSSFSFPLKQELKEAIDQIKSQKIKFYVEIAVEKINKVMEEHYYIVRRFFLIKVILILDTIAIITGLVNMITGANSQNMQYLGKLFFGLGFFILFVSWVEAFLYIFDYQKYIDNSQFNDSIDNEDHLYEDENLTIFTEDSYVGKQMLLQVQIQFFNQINQQFYVKIEIQDQQKRVPQNFMYLEVNPKKREKIKSLQQQLLKLKFANHKLELSIRSRKGKQEEHIFQKIYEKKKQEEQEIQRQLEELQIDDSDSSEFWSFSDESEEITEHHQPLTPQHFQQKNNAMYKYNNNQMNKNDLSNGNRNGVNKGILNKNNSNNINYTNNNNNNNNNSNNNNLNYSGHQIRVGPSVNRNNMNKNRQQFFQFIVPPGGQE